MDAGQALILGGTFGFLLGVGFCRLLFPRPSEPSPWSASDRADILARIRILEDHVRALEGKR
jgi:nitrate reductase gamma subunit